MKSFLKNIYLNFRKYLLRVLAILIFDKKLPNFGSGENIQRILFIRIDRIGDLVLSIPALKALKVAFPHSQLVVLASPSNQSLLLHDRYVDKVFVYDQNKRLADKMRIMKQIRAHCFDLAIDPYPDYEVKTALIALLSGSKWRIGYSSYGRRVFFNLNGPKLEKDKHLVDLTLDILKPLGVRSNHKKPEIFLTVDEKKWARDWLKEKGAGMKPIIGIHPGGYYETQRWLPERFAEVANHLKKNGSLDILIFGGPREKGLVDQITSMVNGAVMTYVGGNLRRFMALVDSCCMLICNNSGPLHVAVALDIPTISIMGPTNKDRWMPIGDIHKVLRIDHLPCIGCNLGYCKIETHDCMNLITSSMVIEGVKNILDSNCLSDGSLL
ncbi:MAG: glycosyltransferase family 9 protein [Deltaproteobacteria bacterium]|nr:glycosyltransferase family 9 protein [Deltaproteobacteria bacterium]